MEKLHLSVKAFLAVQVTKLLLMNQTQGKETNTRAEVNHKCTSIKRVFELSKEKFEIYELITISGVW